MKKKRKAAKIELCFYISTSLPSNKTGVNYLARKFATNFTIVHNYSVSHNFIYPPAKNRGSGNRVSDFHVSGGAPVYGYQAVGRKLKKGVKNIFLCFYLFFLLTLDSLIILRIGGV